MCLPDRWHKNNVRGILVHEPLVPKRKDADKPVCFSSGTKIEGDRIADGNYKFCLQEGEDFLKMELSGRRSRREEKQMLSIPTGLSHIVLSSVFTFR